MNAKPPLREPISGEFVDGVFEVEKPHREGRARRATWNARATWKDILEHVHMIEEEGKLLADNDHPTTQYKQLSARHTGRRKDGNIGGKPSCVWRQALMKSGRTLEADKGYKNGNEHHTVG